MKYFISVFIATLAGIILYACHKSYLDTPVLGQLDESQVSNKKGVDELLIGAYSLLDGIGASSGNAPIGSSAASNWIYGSICGSEAYTGGQGLGDQPDIISLEAFKTTATNDYLDGKWGAVYEGIQDANTVLRIMRKAADMTTADTTEVKAEALFLRAFYHFEAKKMWNKIPFIDEYVTYEAGNYHVANDTSWSHIESDFLYAVQNLPATQLNIGRVNKYAAEAFLAKAYMFEHKYQQAQPLLQDIISNGVNPAGQLYALNSHYADNFNPATKNSTESVFAAQTSVNDRSGGLNGNFGDFYNFPDGGLGPGGCCGFFRPSQYLVNHFKTDPVTGLPDLDTFSDNPVTSDEGYTPDSSFTPYQGSLDPRLDWTVGRRGIPYLDWGIETGANWVRDQIDFGPYVPKKNVYSKAQQGQLTDNSVGWSNSAVANNVNLLRFADVLLWAAEVEVESPNGDLNKARDYVNRIRARAADSTGWVYTYIDPNNPSSGFSATPAANYKIGLYAQPWTDRDYARKAVRYERMLELGMEGHRFFDLVRWGIANSEINAYLLKEQALRYTYMTGAVFTPNKNEYFPIPQTQLDLSAGADGVRKMTQNPGY